MAKNPNKANNVTDSGKIISFQDNLSKIASQETRLDEFSRLYNNAVQSKNKKNISYYSSKLEQEMKLIESLTLDANTAKKNLKAFTQNKSSYMASDLTIKSDVIKAEVNK